ncbi:hypothetical protein BZG36_05482, partial [Bifiguratus adelaidae]
MPTPRVAIIGGGPSGIAAAIQLKRQLGIETVTIFEKSDKIGDWTYKYSYQPEILAYFTRVYHEFGMTSKARLGVVVPEISWSDERQVWTVTLMNAKTRELIGKEEFEVVVSAIGGLHIPSFPDIKGRLSYKGESFHSAQWNHKVDLKDKKVAVIGNACSAAQFVPEIAKEVKELHVYQRTPNYMVPRRNFKFPWWLKLVFRYVPGAQRLWRLAGFIASEMSQLAFRRHGGIVAKLATYAVALPHLRRLIKDPELRAKLTPKYAFGCKRVIVSDDYYPALTRPNVHLITERINEITEDGITSGREEKGQLVPTHRDYDVIIYGTGFEVRRFLSQLKIHGKAGLDLGEFWTLAGGVDAFKGTMVPGFPNFFTMLGPNTALGHYSVIFQIECQIDLMIRVLRKIMKDGKGSVEPTKDAYLKYNQYLQKKMGTTVWSAGGCDSWYKTESGKVTTVWPGTCTEFMLDMRRGSWNDYTMEGPKDWDKPKANLSFLLGSLVLGVVAVTASY